MKKFLFFLLLLSALPTFAQSFWNDLPESSIPLVGERRIIPSVYRTVWLNVAEMQTFLSTAPLRFTAPAANMATLPILTLPTPDGRLSRFRLVESPVMAPELQAKYSETRCYTGYGLDDPSAFLKCDLTPWGFHAMIFAGNNSYFIDPYSHGDRNNYVVYYKKDYPLPAGKTFVCEVEETKTTPYTPYQAPDQGSCTLKFYRLALACTGEYAAFFGGTKPLAIAAMNSSVNRVNGVYELEVAITMSLVANNDLIVYTNASTDPYTNNNGSTMLTQNQTTCTNIIGTANYDIGHVFSTGGGGVAILGCVCASGSKAQGVTGSSAPVGDNFDIDYVAHEMGHQFGGNHTFNGTNGSCGGGNRNLPTAYEPGSGSTIMAYAGICSGQDVQAHSDAYFHAISLQEIGNFTTGSNGGNSCDQILNSSNNPPTVNAGPDYTIPKSTPFALTASGTDPNGNALTYNWEQMDQQNSTQPPVSTNTGGPTFRSFTADGSPTRVFPMLSTIINNSASTWEVLPSVTRTLHFRVTARDIGAAYGCTGEDNTIISVNAGAGPFQVTSPNTAVSLNINSPQTVTWNVANTTATPVSCANVQISMSTDGGFTYPYVLLASTPNDGSQVVTLPNILSTTCRIKIEAVGNVFFDISNANFTTISVLPVELVDFQARLQNQQTALLTWLTASETNNRGFEIEKKKEEDADFQTVGFVAGKGMVAFQNNYQFQVTGLTEGIWQFRLKELDFDGKTVYSPIRNLQVHDGFSVKIFPNPVQSQVNLVVFQETEGFVSLELVNQLGQHFDLLSTQTLGKGYSQLQLPVSTLPAGLYTYFCRSENGAQQGKLVIER